MLIPGDTLIFDVTASDVGYTSVNISFYNDINNMSFDEAGHNTGDSPSWKDRIVKCKMDSSPSQGNYEIPVYLENGGALVIEGGGSIGTSETSRYYLFLYKWQE